MRLATAIPRVAPSPSLERRQQRPLAIATIALAAALVLFGNAFSAMPVELHDHPAAVAAKVIVAVVVVAATVAFARVSLRDAGICRDGCIRGLALGSLLALALAVPIVVYFAFPIGMPGREIEYGAVSDRSTASFLVWMLVTLPLATALFEEVAFRGCLQGVAVRAYGTILGIAIMAMAFTLWHGVINFRTIQSTNAAGGMALSSAAYVASALGLFVGGVLLGALRQRTGSIAAPFAFHWLIVLAMNTTLFVLSRT